MLVPRDYFRVPRYPIRDPRLPRCPENIFSPIIYCTLVINSRFYLIKSKGSDFVGLGSQFWPFN